MLVSVAVSLLTIASILSIATHEWAIDEFMVDTAIVYCPPEGWDAPNGIAFDGTNYFVVFDGQCGARISRSGELLDTTLIAFSDSIGVGATVTFDGNNYLAAWRGGLLLHTVYATRINTDGVVLDRPPITVLGPGPPDMRYLRSAFGGGNHLIVFEESHFGTWLDIHGVRVSPSGVVLDSGGFVIREAPYHQEAPAVAFNSGRHLVIWENSNDTLKIQGARVTSEAAVLDTAPILNFPIAWSQSITSGGSDWLVVWVGMGADTTADIFATRVDSTGSVLDTVPIAVAGGPYHQGYPGAGFNGTQYLVAWSNPRPGGADVYCSRVGIDGSVLDPEGIQVSKDGQCCLRNVLVSSDSSSYLVVWCDFRLGSADAYCARVGGDGELLDSTPIPIVLKPNNQRHAEIVAGNTCYLVAWQDYRKTGAGETSRNASVYGAVLAPEGGSAAETFLIANSTWGAASPEAAWDGSNFLVVWEVPADDGYNIFGTRVTSEGTVLDSSAIPVSAGAGDQMSPSVAFGRDDYLVVWELPGHNYDIEGVRISRDGTVLDPDPIPICICTTYASSPRVSSDGTDYLVVWKECINWWPSTWQICGALIDTAGHVVDPEALLIPANAAKIDVCHGGSYYFVVWAYDRDIYGARVKADGILLDTTWICISSRSERECSPTAVFDGNNFLVTWEIEGADYDIQGALVDTSGQVIDRFPISTSQGNQMYPSAASLQENVMVVYQSRVGAPYEVFRICGASPHTRVLERHLVPPSMGLFHVFPNPCRGQVTMAYGVERSCRVYLRVFDTSGRLVRVLLDKRQSPGYHRVNWDGTNRYGNRLPTGVYYLRLEIGDEVFTRKQIHLR